MLESYSNRSKTINTTPEVKKTFAHGVTRGRVSHIGVGVRKLFIFFWFNQLLKKMCWGHKNVPCEKAVKKQGFFGPCDGGGKKLKKKFMGVFGHMGPKQRFEKESVFSLFGGLGQTEKKGVLVGSRKKSWGSTFNCNKKGNKFGF